MRAFVTGGRGFVGRWLTAHLVEEGDDVTVVDAETEVTDEEAVARAIEASGADAVYHLAARTHVGESWRDPLGVLRVNAMGTAAVLAAARRSAPEATVVVVSSAEVYGTVDPGELPVAEGAPLRPATPYAASKAAAEQFAFQAWRGYGQRVVVVRPFNHVGPGQSAAFAVPALARRVLAARRDASRELVVGTVTTRRDFTDVRDVVRAYRLLVGRAEPGTVVNVCTGRDVAISEVADRLMALAGVDLEMVTDLGLVRPVDTPVLRGDPSRLAEVTGWTPRIPLEVTLRDVLEQLERDDAQAPGAPS
ncbi:MAG TPA: GDP-mannose 4,6-dehydratase [Acidimicrobiales bacterium]|nr:GDP-mannose 4,6-dehydratase [Acidimicrobiales bacterium]